MHYQEVRSGQLGTSFLILFFDFFLFDYLGAVPENPGTVIRGVRLSVGPVYRDTTVVKCIDLKLPPLGTTFAKIHSAHM